MTTSAAPPLTTSQYFDARLFEGGTPEARVAAAEAFVGAITAQCPGTYPLTLGEGPHDPVQVNLETWPEDALFEGRVWATFACHGVCVHD